MFQGGFPAAESLNLLRQQAHWVSAHNYMIGEPLRLCARGQSPENRGKRFAAPAKIFRELLIYAHDLLNELLIVLAVRLDEIYRRVGVNVVYAREKICRVVPPFYFLGKRVHVFADEL